MKRILIADDHKILKEINNNIDTDIHAKNIFSRIIDTFKPKRTKPFKNNTLKEIREKLNSNINKSA